MILHAEERPHATPFSPSSFTRAEACTKSIELMRSAHAHAPQRAASFDALFGTVAHEVLACACALVSRPLGPLRSSSRASRCP